MNEEEGYDVLRLIEHGKSCYISSEYVKGSPLIRWIKYHPNLSKEQLFIWMQEMARQLQCIHNCRGNPCYQYVNPYSVIITEEKKYSDIMFMCFDVNDLVIKYKKEHILYDFITL